MNIHGLKLKLIPIRKELREGERKLGKNRYDFLINQRARINFKIKELREKKKKK